MYFPVTCVDNFFNDPDSVREFALSLDYQKAFKGEWPGKRTECLSHLAPHFYHTFCQKIFSLTYNMKEEQLYTDLVLKFVLIDANELSIDRGWIHQDQSRYAGIVYLTPGMSKDSGTSIFKKNNYVYSIAGAGEIKERLYSGRADQSDFDELQNQWSNFDETIRFSNLYNRLIAFDAAQYHGINSFGSKDEERLTLVFFANEVRSNRFPVPDCKSFSL